MRKVIRIEEPKEEKALKPIELTHCSSLSEWRESEKYPNDFEKIVYLGRCAADGDMFACYHSGVIDIYKGHLNDGVY